MGEPAVGEDARGDQASVADAPAPCRGPNPDNPITGCCRCWVDEEKPCCRCGRDDDGDGSPCSGAIPRPWCCPEADACACPDNGNGRCGDLAEFDGLCSYCARQGRHCDHG